MCQVTAVNTHISAALLCSAVINPSTPWPVSHDSQQIFGEECCCQVSGLSRRSILFITKRAASFLIMSSNLAFSQLQKHKWMCVAVAADHTQPPDHVQKVRPTPPAESPLTLQTRAPHSPVDPQQGPHPLSDPAPQSQLSHPTRE